MECRFVYVPCCHDQALIRLRSACGMFCSSVLHEHLVPDWRQSGCGRRASWCRHDGYFVDLFVRESNNLAITMYTKLGYSTYRRVLGYYSGTEDALGTLVPPAVDCPGHNRQLSSMECQPTRQTHQLVSSCCLCRHEESHAERCGQGIYRSFAKADSPRRTRV
jgi:hypothetical protein